MTTPRLKQFLAPLSPNCISASPTGSITLVSSPREITATLHLKPSTWGNQRGVRSHHSPSATSMAGREELLPCVTMDGRAGDLLRAGERSQKYFFYFIISHNFTKLKCSSVG